MSSLVDMTRISIAAQPRYRNRDKNTERELVRSLERIKQRKQAAARRRAVAPGSRYTVLST